MTTVAGKKAEALAACRFPQLPARYASALRAAVELVLDGFEPTAIVAAGSILRGEGDRTSDLDIYVVHEAPFKQRLQRWVGDVPAEIFVNPPQAIREYFATEHRRGRPSTAHMLATGAIVLGAELLDVLRAEAREWLAKRSPLTPVERTWERYVTAGILDDAMDLVDRDPAMANALLAEAVLAMLRHHLRARDGVLPRSKDLLRRVESDDPDLARAARRFFESSRLEERVASAYTVADRCLGVRGFFEWDTERSPVDAPERTGTPR